MLADEYCDIARGLLALLMMMIYWLLAGFDVLENPNPSELSSPAARLADHGQTAKPSGDFVHYPNHSKLYYFRFCGVASGPLLTGSTAPWLKPDKLCDSAVLSSIAGIAPTEFLNSHSGPPCLNRMIGDFRPSNRSRELSIERRLSNPCESHSKTQCAALLSLRPGYDSKGTCFHTKRRIELNDHHRI